MKWDAAQGKADHSFSESRLQKEREFMATTCWHAEYSKLLGSEISLTGVDNQLSAPLRIDHGQLGKSDVIADRNPEAARIRVDHSACLARAQRVRLLECHPAWDVYVKQMHLHAGSTSNFN